VDVEIAKLVDEDRLGHRVDPGRRHPGELVIPQEAAMLDPMAASLDRLLRRRGLLHARQNLLDRGIADGMDRKLIAKVVVAGQEPVHFLLREAEKAPVVRFSGNVRLAHRRSEAAGAAIAKDLHRAIAQPADLPTEAMAGRMGDIRDPIRIAIDADPRAYRKAV
jgi:hypothetical protein